MRGLLGAAALGVLGMMVVPRYANHVPRRQPRPRTLLVTAADLKGTLNAIGHFSFRRVRGGGAIVGTDAALATVVEFYGRREIRKIAVTTYYGASSGHRLRLLEQVSLDDVVCGAVSTQAVQNWCRARVIAQVATNATTSKKVKATTSYGTGPVSDRFVVTTRKNALEAAHITITPA